MVVALSRCSAIGVDVETKDDRPAEPIARLLADEEQQALLAVSPDKRSLAFHILWTRKEAVAKVLGRGLALPLGSFAVSAPFEPAMIVRRPCPPPWPDDLRLLDLAAEDRHVGAIAFRGAASALHLFRVRSDSITTDVSRTIALSTKRNVDA